MPKARVTVDVQYCRKWQFAKKFALLKEQIEDEFGANVIVKGIPSPNEDGSFEIFVNGKLVHSKLALKSHTEGI